MDSRRRTFLVAMPIAALVTARRAPESTVMTEDTRRAARRFYETLNRALETGDVTLLDPLLAGDVVDHDPTPGMAPGREGVKRAFAELRAAFPDYRGTVEDLIVEGDKAACRVTGRMTHRGREVTLRGIDILRFERGVLIERWGRFEPLPQ
jgi:ketosteroid isomerase-like protein